MVHMVLAVMQFQYSTRNGTNQSQAMSHYHYAVSFVPDLITGHTLQDLQALALICSQLRNQPRPGAAWLFNNMVISLAIELGLHRSAKAWQGDGAGRDTHTVELRKRIFWSLMTIHVHISGKLGRPMPLRLDEIDIEIPEPTHDHLPTETKMSRWRMCSFRAGIQGFKLLKIQMQIYSTVYSIRSSSEPYDLTVQDLEKKLQAFREQLPPELSGGEDTVEEDRCSAAFLQTAEQGIRLLLHHPSLCRSMSASVMASNLDACLDASSKMLAAATHIMALKSLDTTWYCTMVRILMGKTLPTV